MRMQLDSCASSLLNTLPGRAAVQDDARVRSSNFKVQWMHYECAETHFQRLNQPMTPPVRRYGTITCSQESGPTHVCHGCL